MLLLLITSGLPGLRRKKTYASYTVSIVSLCVSFCTEKVELTRIVFQCIHFLFMDVPTDFNLPDFTQQIPCSSRLWYAKNGHDWRSKQSELRGQLGLHRVGDSLPWHPSP